MLERTAMQQLEDWKAHKTQQALLITGARQVGKTTLVREFARRRYEFLAEINFYERPEAKLTLAQATDSADLLLRISALTGIELNQGTLLFLDEIQECQDMLTWVKFLRERTDVDIVLSGSLLGIDAFLHVRSLPVGFIQKTTLYPLTFEEFRQACGVTQSVWDTAKDCVLAHEPVPDFIHSLLSDRFKKYLLVGGMPLAVQTFIDSTQIVPVRNAQRAIIDFYKEDIAKYVDSPTEARQIKMVYEAIPSQLNTPTKRFAYSRLGKNLRFANMETAFDWLGASGVALEVTRVSEASFPLGLSECRQAFKLFDNDVGLLTSQLMGTVDVDVLNGMTAINYGSIYENYVAQELRAQGFALHYYNSKAHGEVDFIVEDPANGAVLPIEVKSGKDYKRHSALNNLLKENNIKRAVVLCNDNVETDGRKTYLPIYAAPFLRDLV